MKKLILAFALLALTGLASAADSPHDVQALIARGDYQGAEAALRSAIAEHPQSAKAHYVLAEVLAHEGNIGEAKTEASKAATLDPATHFTDPAKFQQFQRELDTALAPASNRRSAASARPLAEGPRVADTGGGAPSHLTGLLVIGAIVALIAFFWSRRRRPNGPADYSQAPPFNGAPPSSGYPGYAPPYAPPAPPAPSSGVGTAVAAGLGGVAAGMLLDEALRSHREGESTREVGSTGYADRDPSAQAYDDLRNDPIDMGNNDSSWDDSSSSGSDSSDDNQW